MLCLKNLEQGYIMIANKLIELIDFETVADALVLSIGKSSMDLAREIALNFGMLEGDFLFIEEVKSPVNKETSLAAISETEDYVLIEELIESFEITNTYIFNECERVYNEQILKDIYQFRGGESIISLEDRDVLLVDRGASTGLTLLCAIKSCVSNNVRSINVAVPFIAKETAEMVSKLVDKTYFLKEIEDYISTDYYYNKENE